MMHPYACNQFWAKHGAMAKEVVKSVKRVSGRGRHSESEEWGYWTALDLNPPLLCLHIQQTDNSGHIWISNYKLCSSSFLHTKSTLFSLRLTLLKIQRPRQASSYFLIHLCFYFVYVLFSFCFSLFSIFFFMCVFIILSCFIVFFIFSFFFHYVFFFPISCICLALQAVTLISHIQKYISSVPACSGHWFPRESFKTAYSDSSILVLTFLLRFLLAIFLLFFILTFFFHSLSAFVILFYFPFRFLVLSLAAFVEIFTQSFILTFSQNLTKVVISWIYFIF